MEIVVVGLFHFLCAREGHVKKMLAMWPILHVLDHVTPYGRARSCKSSSSFQKRELVNEVICNGDMWYINSSRTNRHPVPRLGRIFCKVVTYLTCSANPSPIVFPSSICTANVTMHLYPHRLCRRMARLLSIGSSKKSVSSTSAENASPDNPFETYRISGVPRGVSLGDIKSSFPEAERQMIRSMSQSPAYSTRDHSSLVVTITFDGKPASLVNISSESDSVPLRSCIPKINLSRLYIKDSMWENRRLA